MAIYYYKVPKKITYAPEYDEEGNIIGETDEVMIVEPDLPKNTNFIGSLVGNFYFIKVGRELTQENAVKLGNIPENLLKSKVRGIK